MAKTLQLSDLEDLRRAASMLRVGARAIEWMAQSKRLTDDITEQQSVMMHAEADKSRKLAHRLDKLWKEAK